MLKEYYRLVVTSFLVVILTILNIFPFSKFGDLIDKISKMQLQEMKYVNTNDVFNNISSLLYRCT